MIHAVSDIHMGDGSARDDFALRKAEFLSSIPETRQSDTVLLVGDIVDGTRYSIKETLKANYDVLKSLGDLHPWWIVGNHDEEIWKFQDVLTVMGFRFADRLLLQCDCFSWYVCHGHEWDSANKKGSWTGKTVTGFANLIGRISPKAEDWLARQAQRLEGTGRYDQGSFATTVNAFLQEFSGVQGVIAGHTHVQEERTSAKGKRYVNTGTWLKHGWISIKP